MQDFKAANGFSRWLRYNSPDGKRQDTAHRYVHPLMASGDYPNLHLLVQSTVSRVIFEGNRAVGVEYLPNASFQPITNLTHREPLTIKARKLVVLSAGALGTPQILERSGVGNAELLKKLDIPVVADVPGVGEEYQDHNLIFYSYKTSLKPDQTLDDLHRGRLDFYEAVEKKDPIVTWNAVDLAAKLRPTDEEVAQLDQEFQDHWNRDFKDQTTRPLMLLAVVSSFLGDHKTLAEEQDGPSQYLSIGMYTGYPYSRGDIHITSKDPDAAPCFNAGFLSKWVDLTKQIWAYKKQREIFRRTNVMTSELPVGSPKFREGSKAALRKQPEALDGFKTLEERKALPPIEYDEDDDRAIEEYIRSNIETTWHSLGTCKMAPKEKGGVVDKHLNVYGTVGLKICGKHVLLSSSILRGILTILLLIIFCRPLYCARECRRKHEQHGAYCRRKGGGYHSKRARACCISSVIFRVSGYNLQDTHQYGTRCRPAPPSWVCEASHYLSLNVLLVIT
jgi:alcohol oxidase